MSNLLQTEGSTILWEYSTCCSCSGVADRQNSLIYLHISQVFTCCLGNKLATNIISYGYGFRRLVVFENRREQRYHELLLHLPTHYPSHVVSSYHFNHSRHYRVASHARNVSELEIKFPKIQTHWSRVAPNLAPKSFVICSDRVACRKDCDPPLASATSSRWWWSHDCHVGNRSPDIAVVNKLFP